MKSKNLKRALIITMTAAFSLSASNLAYAGSYTDCVFETWDPFACALNSDNDSWAIGYARFDDREAQKTLEEKMKLGEFSKFESLGKQVIEGRIKQICHAVN